MYGAEWPFITSQELNMDWIFTTLIPEVKALKDSYDNIQQTVETITQQNYTEWRAELNAEMARLRTQIQQANASWQENFTNTNNVWKQGTEQSLDQKFQNWSNAQEALIHQWEDSTYNTLVGLVNSFANDIADSEARSKAYADQLNREQQTFIQQQISQLNDAMQHQLNELQQQINSLNTAFADYKIELKTWQGAIEASQQAFKQDVNAEISKFEDNITSSLNTHKNWVQQQIVSIQTNIDEQVRLLNARISALTASDIGAIDPVTGDTENVQFVLRHLFDVFSDWRGCITAEEYKQLGITAGEYKEDYNYPAVLYSIASWYLLKIRSWKRPAVYYNGEYVTPAELEQRLVDYITKAVVDAEFADYATTNDVDLKLAEYIKTKDMVSYLATTLENYVTYNSLQTTLQDYATPEDLEKFQADIDSKATQQQLNTLRTDVYAELDNYAKLNELPDFSQYLTEAEAVDTFASLTDFNQLDEQYQEFVKQMNININTIDDKIGKKLDITTASDTYATIAEYNEFKQIYNQYVLDTSEVLTKIDTDIRGISGVLTTHQTQINQQRSRIVALEAANGNFSTNVQYLIAHTTSTSWSNLGNTNAVLQFKGFTIIYDRTTNVILDVVFDRHVFDADINILTLVLTSAVGGSANYTAPYCIYTDPITLNITPSSTSTIVAPSSGVYTKTIYMQAVNNGKFPFYPTDAMFVVRHTGNGNFTLTIIFNLVPLNPTITNPMNIPAGTYSLTWGERNNVAAAANILEVE